MAAMLAVMVACAATLTAATGDFENRAKTIVDFQAHPKGAGGYATIAARLKLHETPEWCSKRLIEMLDAGPTGDMFWMFPVTAIAYLDQGQLSPDARKSLRRAWKT